MKKYLLLAAFLFATPVFASSSLTINPTALMSTQSGTFTYATDPGEAICAVNPAQDTVYGLAWDGAASGPTSGTWAAITGFPFQVGDWQFFQVAYTGIPGAPCPDVPTTLGGTPLQTESLINPSSISPTSLGSGNAAIHLIVSTGQRLFTFTPSGSWITNLAYNADNHIEGAVDTTQSFDTVFDNGEHGTYHMPVCQNVPGACGEGSLAGIQADPNYLYTLDVAMNTFQPGIVGGFSATSSLAAVAAAVSPLGQATFPIALLVAGLLVGGAIVVLVMLSLQKAIFKGTRRIRPGYYFSKKGGPLKRYRNQRMGRYMANVQNKGYTRF